MRISLFLLGLLVTGAAVAEQDSFGLGTGRNGQLRVTQQDTVINRASQLTANAAAGALVLTISNAASFAAGELVLVHQSAGLQPAPASGDQLPLALGSSPVGQFEYARVESVLTGALRLTAPLRHGYAAGASQVVSVPEYTDVQVLADASLKALPWHGREGGILALLATGTLTHQGVISADGAGFRGGAFLNHSGGNGCTSLDEAAGSGGSYKGEGPVAGRFGSAAGRGNLATGGGGGNCHNAGGGGGGHAGVGGKGGFSVGQSTASDDVGGLGGAPVVYLPHERLLFGGGGGAGGGHADSGTPGGAGGGIILIRAGEVAGPGRFSAMGASANPVSAPGDDGAGGGGAGGAISLRSAKALRCGLAQASGGAGGDTRHPVARSGPGGGGSGGLVFLQAESISCPSSVAAGQPGQSTAAGGTFGAGPGAGSSGPSSGAELKVLTPFRVPATPVLTSPADGATGVPRKPRFEGTAEPGVAVHLYLDGAPYAKVAAGGNGAFSHSVSAELAPGAHELRAAAEVLGSHSPLSEPRRFQVAEGDGGVPGEGPPEDWPVLLKPAEGGVVDPLVLFTGTSRTGTSVGIEVDGAEVARVPLDGQRRFRYVLTSAQRLATGPHSAIVRAWDDAGRPGPASPVTRFEVRVPNELEVGCGCGASPGAGLALGALLLLAGWALKMTRGTRWDETGAP